MLEDTVPTAHDKIRIFVGSGMPASDIQSWLESLEEICTARDTARLVVALKEMVLDYNPSTDLLKRVILPPPISTVSVSMHGSGFRSQAEQLDTVPAAVGESTRQ